MPQCHTANKVPNIIHNPQKLFNQNIVSTTELCPPLWPSYLCNTTSNAIIFLPDFFHVMVLWDFWKSRESAIEWLLHVFIEKVLRLETWPQSSCVAILMVVKSETSQANVLTSRPCGRIFMCWRIWYRLIALSLLFQKPRRTITWKKSGKKIIAVKVVLHR